MIAVAQLDPASLALWYTPDLLHFGGAGEDTARPAAAALAGAVLEAVEGIERLPPDATRVRAAHLASVVWHEHRHFADLLLTNYGAFRVRQYLLAYANMQQVLGEAGQAGTPLFCPITAYADVVERDVYGLSALPVCVEPVARQMAMATTMLSRERQIVRAPWGTLEAGGDAQLEALAYAFQYGAVGALFGDALSTAVQADLPARQRANETYRWAARFALAHGIAAGEERADDTVAITDFTLMNAILLGSLSARLWGQPQTADRARVPFSHSGYTWSRLDGLVRELSGRGRRPVASGDAWEMVNDASRKLWGRTVLDELRADYTHEAAAIAQVTDNPDGAAWAARAWAEFHEVRGQLLALLESTPAAFLNPVRYTSELLPRLRPLTILAVPHGILGTPPAGYQLVMGYRHETPHPEGEWWWAAAHNTEPEPWAITLRDREVWLQIVEFGAPVAKLLMAGRAHHLALGPELISAEQRLRTLGVELRFHPMFRSPGPAPDLSYFFDLRGASEARCDWCGRTVVAPTGALVSPWELRKSGKRMELTVAALGGGETGYLRYLRDWSLWVACDEHARMFA